MSKIILYICGFLLLLQLTLLVSAADISGSVGTGSLCAHAGSNAWYPSEFTDLEVSESGNYSFSITGGPGLMYLRLFEASYDCTQAYNQPSYMGFTSTISLDLNLYLTSGTRYIMLISSAAGTISQTACETSIWAYQTYTASVTGTGTV